MRIAALVVVFHPDKELLQANIMAFADSADAIIIWRNSDFPEEWISEWEGKTVLAGDCSNAMMAHPVNEAMKWARQHGFSHLLTMDQDSRWQDFAGFLEKAGGLPHDDNVAIFAPNANGHLKDTPSGYKDLEWVIQSGMLIDLDAVEGLGGFREDYGIYGIDEEFCHWIRLNGKKTRCLTGFRLDQKYGEARKTAFGFTVYNYSPFVRYHLIRNMIWMKREFPHSTVTRRILHVIFDNIRDIILAENNKRQKLASFCRGIFHGLFGKIDRRSVTRCE